MHMFRWQITLITRKVKGLKIHIESFTLVEKEDETHSEFMQNIILIKRLTKVGKKILNVIIPAISSAILP
uniref:Uncharacterized protein n=1 Tax=Uncultured archaeon GZfos26G2 TaxID=3386331 RepID=Q648H2_UNCAG|nr:hypothetical protein GZ37D1_52 [uncultured archaeon GZfos37D1]